MSSTLNIGTGLSDLGSAGAAPAARRLRVTAGQLIVTGVDTLFTYAPSLGVGSPIGLLLSLTKSS